MGPRMTTRARSASAATLFAMVLLAGCGAGMRNVVESDMRFEHCYRLDEDRATPLDAKRACWHEWMGRYAKGQDRARIRYAHDRSVVLDDAARGVSMLPSPPPGETTDGPAPASPYEVPPSVAPRSTSEPEAIAPRRSIEVCTESCTRAWRTCAGECSGADACGGACEDRYRGCLKGCL